MVPNRHSTWPYYNLIRGALSPLTEQVLQPRPVEAEGAPDHGEELRGGQPQGGGGRLLRLHRGHQEGDGQAAAAATTAAGGGGGGRGGGRRGRSAHARKVL